MSEYHTAFILEGTNRQPAPRGTERSSETETKIEKNLVLEYFGQRCILMGQQ